MKNAVGKEIRSRVFIDLPAWIVRNLSEEYEDHNDCDALDKQQTKDFVNEILPEISGGKMFSDEKFDACFMEFDQEESGFIEKDKMTDFSIKLMCPDSDLGEDHFPEFSLLDTTEYVVRLAN